MKKMLKYHYSIFINIILMQNHEKLEINIFKINMKWIFANLLYNSHQVDNVIWYKLNSHYYDKCIILKYYYFKKYIISHLQLSYFICISILFIINVLFSYLFNVFYHYFINYHYFIQFMFKFAKYDDEDNHSNNIIYLLCDVFWS